MTTLETTIKGAEKTTASETGSDKRRNTRRGSVPTPDAVNGPHMTELSFKDEKGAIHKVMAPDWLNRKSVEICAASARMYREQVQPAEDAAKDAAEALENVRAEQSAELYGLADEVTRAANGDANRAGSLWLAVIDYAERSVLPNLPKIDGKAPGRMAAFGMVWINGVREIRDLFRRGRHVNEQHPTNEDGKAFDDKGKERKDLRVFPSLSAITKSNAEYRSGERAPSVKFGSVTPKLLAVLKQLAETAPKLSSDAQNKLATDLHDVVQEAADSLKRDTEAATERKAGQSSGMLANGRGTRAA